MKKVISVLTAVLLASSVSMPAQAATGQAVTGVSAHYEQTSATWLAGLFLLTELESLAIQ